MHTMSTPSSCEFIVKSAFIGKHYRCNKDSYRQASYVSGKCLNCYGSMLRYHPGKMYWVCHNLRKTLNYHFKNDMNLCFEVEKEPSETGNECSVSRCT